MSTCPSPFHPAKFFALLGLACAFLIPTQSLAQTDSGDFVIRVKTQEVVVPVWVLDKEAHSEELILTGNRSTTYFTREVKGLSSKDFHIFEDGIEQKVETVTAEQFRWWPIIDNVSQHLESSVTPRGVWATSASQAFVPFQVFPLGGLYLVSYTPPSSPDGSCHNLNITVNRKKADVFSRKQYCTVPNSPTDPLNGSQLGKQLATFADSTETGTLPVSNQAVFFAGASRASRLDVALEFLSHELRPDGTATRLMQMAVLGMVYDKSGNLVERFSDTPGYSLSISVNSSSPVYLPQNRYETQIALLPGEYDLKIVATDGKSLGKMKQTIDIPQLQVPPLDISGIALCKRYHKPLEGRAKQLRPSEFVPLVAKGMEFTPAGDTRLKQGEKLAIYLELYTTQASASISPKVYVEMKITQTKTNELKVGTGLRRVESLTQPGNSTIPVVWDLAVDKLSPGPYRLEVQGSDSTGNKTPWRSASFSLE